MARMFLAVLGAIILLSAPATAAKMTEKQKCIEGVTDVRQSMESDETPGTGEKARAEVEKILEISAHLCEQGNFRYAESLLELARGMMASE